MDEDAFFSRKPERLLAGDVDRRGLGGGPDAVVDCGEILAPHSSVFHATQVLLSVNGADTDLQGTRVRGCHSNFVRLETKFHPLQRLM